MEFDNNNSRFGVEKMNNKLHIGIISALWIMVFVVSSFIEPKLSASENGKNEIHWSYSGDTGPAHWGELDQKFAACIKGTNQSPINIDTANTPSKQARQINVNYQSSHLTVVNNGHTIEATPQQANNELTIDGMKFTLNQFHFHAESEHQLDRKHYPMELHLVHKNSDGSLAVLGVMIKEGSENSAVSAFWDKLPQNSSKEILTSSKVSILDLIPENKSTYQYVGSLTTPPCTEGVSWFLFKEPIEMSKEQINKFAEIFPANNRPVQPNHSQEVIFAK